MHDEEVKVMEEFTFVKSIEQKVHQNKINKEKLKHGDETLSA